MATPASTTHSIASRRQRVQPAISSDDEDYFAHSDALPTPDIDVTRTLDGPPSTSLGGLPYSVRRVKSPHLHVGRDGGGTYSGHASLAGSDTDASEDEARRHSRVASLNARIKTAVASVSREEVKTEDDESDDYRRPRHGRCANRLGDAPTSCGDGASDSGMDPDDLEKAEEEDRSISGSVY